MGVIYKLKPEVAEYIIEQKKASPALSCRNLVGLIEDRFQAKVSKSSINSVIKEAGLSMPVGRRAKKRRRKLHPLLDSKEKIEIKPTEVPLLETEEKKLIEAQVFVTEEPQKIIAEVPVTEAPQTEPFPEMPSGIEGTGAILLKIADCLIGGSRQITKAIQRHLIDEENLYTKTESLIYLPLFNLKEEKELAKFWAILDKKISPEAIQGHLAKLREVNLQPIEISDVIYNLLQEIRCIKVELSDGAMFYLDGQLHTIWSTPQIPYDFSSPLYNVNSYINKHFKEHQPLILFSAPGYELPTKELFDFISSLENQEKKVSKITCYNSKLQPLQTMLLEPIKKFPFIFALWPWQFGQYRRAKLSGEFKEIYIGHLQAKFYISKVEVELSQPDVNKCVTLRGLALKLNPNERIKLIILSNFGDEKGNEDLVNLYLSRWSNPEEAFQDFSRKIELFTYSISSTSLFPDKEEPQGIEEAFAYYLKSLDYYVRRCFLPSEYEKEDIYSLKTLLKKESKTFLITFQPAQGYPFLRAVEYACNRINEAEVTFIDGRRIQCIVRT